jgi:uncharacterized protein involved in exopolysaccharide biosynthesis
MKRVLKFLALLYPSAWRKRYGVEYEALLDQGMPRARDAFDVLWAAAKMHMTSWGFVRIVLPFAIAGTLIAAAISFAIPPQYVSQTVILVTVGDGAAGPKDETIGRDSADASLRDLKGTLLSDASLTPIIQKLDLYPRDRTRMPQEGMINQMRRDIYFRPVMKGPGQSAFALQFSYPDPHAAQRVDAELVSAMMESHLRLSMNHSSTTPDRHETFRVEHAANLPLGPSFPQRGVFGAGGLFAGIGGGLILASVMRRHRESVTAI